METIKSNYFPSPSYFSPSEFLNKTDVIFRQLNETGLIFIKDVFLDSDALLIARKLGRITKNIDASIRGVTEISNQRKGKNERNSAAFTLKELYPHTDRSPLKSPPSLLMNWLIKKPNKGGEALLVDGYEVFAYLRAYHSDVIQILSCHDVACFTDGIDTFTGPIFHIDSAGVLHVRFRFDQCVIFKEEAMNAIRILRETIDRFTLVQPFDTGSGYIIANNRWLHGRKAFEGNRTVKRVHIMKTF